MGLLAWNVLFPVQVSLGVEHSRSCAVLRVATFPMIRLARETDAAALCQIYNHYVSTTTITFEEQPVGEAEMAGRIGEVTKTLPWLVEETAEGVVGYAYASKWRVRAAYRRSVESTVYVQAGHVGRGIGRALYERLLADLRSRQVHCVIGGVALPNAASVALHERLGFTQVAHFREVGHKFGRWLDVGYWQLLLEG